MNKLATTIKVILADDHEMVRKGIKGLLSGAKGIKILGEAETGAGVLMQMRQKKANVVLMDINMPEMNGIEATKKICTKFPDVKVIGLTMYMESSYISKMLSAGAVGYLPKSTERGELVTAIRTVMRGENYFGENVSEALMAGLMPDRVQDPEVPGFLELDLSRREMEILGMISNEFTNQEIAEKLYLSKRTVDTHRRNLLQKLGVKNTAGLVRYAILKGYVA